jgi:ATPase subunit of ABC transporter with duplicated ATPase domains
MLDKMDRIEEVTESRRMVLNMAGSRGSKKALQMVGVTKQFENGRLLFDNLDFTLWHGERVGLVGANGAGKSFLFRQLLNPDDIDGGQITIGPSNSIGYYDQEHETLNYDQDLITEIRRTTAVARGTAVSILRRFLFSYDQMQLPISKLSGGERSRLQLAKLMLGKPNLLLLDEPTNNLDIPTIEVLEEVLDEFNGAMLIISHDRYFLDKTVDKIVELKNGRLTEFEHGGYTDYLARVMDE